MVHYTLTFQGAVILSPLHTANKWRGLVSFVNLSTYIHAYVHTYIQIHTHTHTVRSQWWCLAWSLEILYYGCVSECQHNV